MPSSYQGFISPVLEKVLESRPRSVLDVGLGFGKWGFLFREYLDAFWGRSAPSEWQAKIDGIEAHAPYLTGHHRVYSHIHNGNALHVLPLLPDYDFIFAGDMLEHLHKEDGRKLLSMIRAKSRLAMLSVPFGDQWPQGPVSGNLYECHRAVWEKEDFGDAQEVVVHQFLGRPIGLVTYVKGGNDGHGRVVTVPSKPVNPPPPGPPLAKGGERMEAARCRYYEAGEMRRLKPGLRTRRLKPGLQRGWTPRLKHALTPALSQGERGMWGHDGM
ncbi:MAG: class I SAM-dependent methyltransferase [Deltaproteobacteria bacterium]